MNYECSLNSHLSFRIQHSKFGKPPATSSRQLLTKGTKMTIELITPIAMEEQLRFAIREGGRTVGAGVVTKILK